MHCLPCHLTQSAQPRLAVTTCHDTLAPLPRDLRDVMSCNANVRQLTVGQGIQLPCGFAGSQPPAKAGKND